VSKPKTVIYIQQYIKGSGYWPSKKDLPLNYFTYGFGARAAREFKKYNPEFNVECWRLDTSEKQYCENRIEDVDFKIFPAFGNSRSGVYSLKFLKKLRSINETFILNVQGVHKPLLYLILFFKKKNMIVTAQHHGEFSPYFNIKYKYLLKKILSVFYLIFEKLFIKRVDFFFLIDTNHIQYLKRTYKNLTNEKYILQPVGVDTNSFYPLNKTDAKNMLGLDKDKRYLFYLGAYYSFKEVDKLVKIYENVKKKCSNVQLIVAGGSKKDEYYKDVINCGAIELGIILNSELNKYYSAADIYVCCSFRYDYFGGIGIAMLEALACNTPVVSKSLENLPEEKRVLCGKTPGNEGEMTEDIIEVLNSMENYRYTHEVVKSLYDYSVIQKNVRICYDKLMENRVEKAQ
jgi:glycosyltransferase involved in cell wall biosynthesis